MTQCIWTLLSVNELEFITTSSFESKLKGLSLFHLIHPDEVSLAKRDLFKFTHSNFLGGSVTRCRLKDYNTHNFSLKSNLYMIIDIIMYVATNDLVLAFLHSPGEESSNSTSMNLCGDSKHNSINSSNNFCALTLKESLIEQDKLLSPSLSTSSSLSSIESIQYEYSDSSPHQFLYILDSKTKSVLLSWPDHYPNEIGSADYYYSNLISSFDDRPMLPGTSCFRCVQQPSRINSKGQKLDSLIIEYGSITFLLVYLERKKSKQHIIIPPSSRPLSLPCSPNKYNQLDEYPLRRTSEPCSPVNLHQKQRKYQPYPSAVSLENLLLPTQQHNSDKQQQYNSNKHHCQSCGTESSPEWRRGPTGHKTLCNACGLRYSRSVARQGKMIANQSKQQQQQQHSLFQSQNTPHQPSSSYHYHFVSSK